MSITVKIAPDLMERVRALAYSRNRGKEKYHESPRFAKNMTDYDANVLGLMGEVAVAMVLGTKVDTSISALGDGGAKDTEYMGMSVQVKAVAREDGSLYFRGNGKFSSDIAVLTTLVNGATDEMRLAGWIRREDFEKRCHNASFARSGESLPSVAQYQLEPMEKLLAMRCNL